MPLINPTAQPDANRPSHARFHNESQQCASAQKICAFLFGLAILLCLPLLFWSQYIPNDAANFYAPMIREFGAGNYAGAFFTMIPPLFVIVGGFFAKLGCSAFSAAKLASCLFYALTVFPLFGLGSMVWERRTAIRTVILFLFCHQLLANAGSGLLDTGKIFFLTLTIYGLLRAWRTWDWSGLWAIAVGTAGLALIRGEGIFFSFLAWGSLLVLALCRPQPWSQKARVLPVLLAAGIALSPWIAYEWKTTGYPVTDSRQIASITSVLTKIGLPENTLRPDMSSSPGISSPPKPMGTRLPKEKRNLGEMATEIGKGFYPPYALFALIGIGIRFYKRRWQKEEWLLFGAIVCHTAFLIVVLHILNSALVQKRYVIAVLPLLLGWVVIGLGEVTDCLQNRFAFTRGQTFKNSLLAFLGAIFLWHGYDTIHHSPEKRLKNEIERDCGQWLVKEGRKYIPREAKPLTTTATQYHNGRLPILLTVNPQVAFWAQADNVLISKGSWYSLAEILSLISQNGIQFVIWDRKLVDRCPELEDLNNLPQTFSIVYDKWSQGLHRTIILAYRPHTTLSQDSFAIPAVTYLRMQTLPKNAVSANQRSCCMENRGEAMN